MAGERTIEDVARELARYSPSIVTSAERFDWSHFWAEITAWPPDVFAFTSMLLGESGAYLRAVSPPSGEDWPPEDWLITVAADSGGWFHWVVESLKSGSMDAAGAGPRVLSEFYERLTAGQSMPLADLVKDSGWPVCAALLHLHALADEACFGVGVVGSSHEESSPVHERATDLLADTGSLAHFSTDVVRVLPKLRTPQAGITLRSLSHNLAADRSEVGVTWGTVANPKRGALDGMNILLVPWPVSINPTDFRQARGPLSRMDRNHFGFFEFSPSSVGAMEYTRTALRAARKQYGRVDAIVLPEAALSEGDLREMEAMLLGEDDPPLLIAGVRGKERNYARLFDRGGHATSYEQDKHHRWYLDDPQIRQYALGPILPARRRWWEMMEIRPRKVNFVVVNDWLTLCPLICEDLARQDPVARLIQAVGPTLVVALLLDGPQLARRWPGRYASGLADDPGTSVLTLTSLGMTLRSRPPAGGSVSRVIALWKDAVTGVHEIAIEPAACAVLLSVHVEWKTEWTADGRDDGGTAAVVVQNGWCQVMPV